MDFFFSPSPTYIFHQPLGLIYSRLNQACFFSTSRLELGRLQEITLNLALAVRHVVAHAVWLHRGAGVECKNNHGCASDVYGRDQAILTN